MEKKKKLLENIYFLYAVSAYILNADGEVLEQYGDNAMKDVFITDKALFGRMQKNCLDTGAACIFWEEPKIFYCGFKVEELLFVCGPMSAEYLTEKEISQYKRKHDIYTEEYFIPKVEKEKICFTLNLIRIMDGDTGCIWEEDGELEKNQKEKEIYDYRYRKFLSDQNHVSYQTEKKWLEAVRTGNLEMVEKILLATNPDDVGVLADNEYKQAEYMRVVMVALMTRAAIEGGVDAAKAYEISDLYLQKIGKSKTPRQLENISREAAYSFVRLVRDRQNAISYDYIEQCKNYVSAHFQENIKVCTMAEHIGLEESYLGRIFKEREGITIKEYIRKEKMKVAANMLKYSDLSISQISDFLSYHSKSYFGEIFLKTFNMTPHNYRRAYKPVNFK